MNILINNQIIILNKKNLLDEIIEENSIKVQKITPYVTEIKDILTKSQYNNSVTNTVTTLSNISGGEIKNKIFEYALQNTYKGKYTTKSLDDINKDLQKITTFIQLLTNKESYDKENLLVMETIHQENALIKYTLENEQILKSNIGAIYENERSITTYKENNDFHYNFKQIKLRSTTIPTPYINLSHDDDTTQLFNVLKFLWDNQLQPNQQPTLITNINKIEINISNFRKILHYINIFKCIEDKKNEWNNIKTFQNVDKNIINILIPNITNWQQFIELINLKGNTKSKEDTINTITECDITNLIKVTKIFINVKLNNFIKEETEETEPIETKINNILTELNQSYSFNNDDTFLQNEQSNIINNNDFTNYGKIYNCDLILKNDIINIEIDKEYCQDNNFYLFKDIYKFIIVNYNNDNNVKEVAKEIIKLSQLYNDDNINKLNKLVKNIIYKKEIYYYNKKYNIEQQVYQNLILIINNSIAKLKKDVINIDDLKLCTQ
jgi:hypothetical protein